MPPLYSVEQLEVLQSAANIFGLSIPELIRRCNRILTPDDDSSSGAAGDSSPSNSFNTEHVSSPPLPYGHYQGPPLHQESMAQSIADWNFQQASAQYANFQDNFMPMVTMPESMHPFGSFSGPMSPASYSSMDSSTLWDNQTYPIATTEGHPNFAPSSNPYMQAVERTSVSSTSSDESLGRKRRSPDDDIAPHPDHSPEEIKRRRTSSDEDNDDRCFPVTQSPPKNNRRSLQLAGPGKRACVRCKMQRIECPIDPVDPTGPCTRCKKLATGKRCLVQLPCLRYRIPDAVLYRPGSTLRMYSDFPFDGPDAGKLRFTTPVPQSDRWIEIRQGHRAPMKLRMRRFTISGDKIAQIEEEKRPLYRHPFELANTREAAQATIRHVSEQLESYVRDGMRDNDPISSEVFATALRTAQTKPKNLIRDTLGLWAACRLSEGDWSISGSETLDLAPDSNGVFHLSPLLDAQLHASDIMDVIGPFTEDALKRLEQQILKKDNFFETFLCIYVLMHNYELMVARQRKVAIKRRCQYRFTNMRFIRAIHSGAKTLLAYFHYICGGWRPFALDWDSLSTSGPFGQLTPDQKALMKKLKGFATAQGERIQAITHSHRYEEPFWFIGQLFDHSWKPRDTFDWDFTVQEPWNAGHTHPFSAGAINTVQV